MVIHTLLKTSTLYTIINHEVMNLTTRDEIKSYIVRAGFTLKEVVRLVNEKYYHTTGVNNLSNKLSKGTLRYREAQEIADVIGYEIVWVPKVNAD